MMDGRVLIQGAAAAMCLVGATALSVPSAGNAAGAMAAYEEMIAIPSIEPQILKNTLQKRALFPIFDECLTHHTTTIALIQEQLKYL